MTTSSPLGQDDETKVNSRINTQEDDALRDLLRLVAQEERITSLTPEQAQADYDAAPAEELSDDLIARIMSEMTKDNDSERGRSSQSFHDEFLQLVKAHHGLRNRMESFSQAAFSISDTRDFEPSHEEKCIAVATRIVQAVDDGIGVCMRLKNDQDPDANHLVVKPLWNRLSRNHADPESRSAIVIRITASLLIARNERDFALRAHGLFQALIGHPEAQFHEAVCKKAPIADGALDEVARLALNADGIDARFARDQCPRTGLSIATYQYLAKVHDIDQLIYDLRDGLNSFFARAACCALAIEGGEEHRSAIDFADALPLLPDPISEVTSTELRIKGSDVLDQLAQSLWLTARTLILSAEPGSWNSSYPVVPIRHSLQSAHATIRALSELKDSLTISGTHWRDIERAREWIAELRRARPASSPKERLHLCLPLLQLAERLFIKPSQYHAMACRLLAFVAQKQGSDRVQQGSIEQLSRFTTFHPAYGSRLHIAEGDRLRYGHSDDVAHTADLREALAEYAKALHSCEEPNKPTHITDLVHFRIWLVYVQLGEYERALEAWKAIQEADRCRAAQRRAGGFRKSVLPTLSEFPEPAGAFLKWDRIPDEVHQELTAILRAAKARVLDTQHQHAISVALECERTPRVLSPPRPRPCFTAFTRQGVDAYDWELPKAKPFADYALGRGWRRTVENLPHWYEDLCSAWSACQIRRILRIADTENLHAMQGVPNFVSSDAMAWVGSASLFVGSFYEAEQMIDKALDSPCSKRTREVLLFGNALALARWGELEKARDILEQLAKESPRCLPAVQLAGHLAGFELAFQHFGTALVKQCLMVFRGFSNELVTIEGGVEDSMQGQYEQLERCQSRLVPRAMHGGDATQQASSRTVDHAPLRALDSVGSPSTVCIVDQHSEEQTLEDWALTMELWPIGTGG